MRDGLTFYGTFFMGFIAVCCIILMTVSRIQKDSHPTELLQECEKTIPRDQHCTLIAVPPTKEDKNDY